MLPPAHIDVAGQLARPPASDTTSGELMQKMSSVKVPPMPGGPCTATFAAGVAHGCWADMTHPPPKMSNSTTPAALVVPLRTPGGAPGGIPPHQAIMGMVGGKNSNRTWAPGTGKLA